VVPNAPTAKPAADDAGTVRAARVEAAPPVGNRLIWRKPGSLRAVLQATGKARCDARTRVPFRTAKEHAMDDPAKGRLKRLLNKIGERAIREVPPELYACEICRRTECLHDEWIVCENRIAHARCLAEHEAASRT
jgi:hypothetical protein